MPTNRHPHWDRDGCQDAQRREYVVDVSEIVGS